MTALNRLLDRIGDPLDDSKPRPLVMLEEFFTDNNDSESIGPYARARCAPPDLYAAFVDLRARDGFHDIRVEISPKLSPLGWPYSDTVWIVSDFDRRELPRQLPSAFWEGFLPCDWLSYPRVDGVTMETLLISDGGYAQGFAYF